MRIRLPMRITTEVIMKMHNPPHPGEVLKALCLEPLNMTITDAAKGLDVSRKTLSSILNGRAGISPEMAVRLSIAFGTSAESWLNQQLQYDLWHAERNSSRPSASPRCHRACGPERVMDWARTPAAGHCRPGLQAA